MEQPTLKWGIIGCGLISSWFVNDLTITREDAKVKHVVTFLGASRVEKCEALYKGFMEKNGSITPNYGSYQDVYDDPDVDIVYIGLPHSMHKDHCIKALKAGKHVLCEKPLCINAKEASEIFAEAEKSGKFFMEGMWTRFFPLMKSVREKVFREKVIGTVYRLFMDMSAVVGFDEFDSESRMKNSKFGAGESLDVGVYNVTYCRLLMDEGLGGNHAPYQLKAFQTLQNGVDTITSVLVKYDDGKQAILTNSGYIKNKQPFLRLEGSKGTIEIWGDNPASPRKVKVSHFDGSSTIFEGDEPGYGFYHEADAIGLDIQAGRTQNEINPWAESLAVMSTLDRVRAEGGLIYEQD